MSRLRGVWPLRIAVTMLVIFGLGCAPMRTPESTASLTPRAGGNPGCGWWAARFIMAWPQESEPNWAMDLFLAHKVVSPVLEKQRGDIELWRFHRRAVRDQAGHQFSFIFYSSPQTAQRVFDSISHDPNLAEMKATGLIVHDSYDDTCKIAKPNVEDTCDPRWSVQIQKSWPYFAMGASEMWLNLIDETIKTLPDTQRPATPSANLELYKRVNDVVKRAWQDEGRHAFLHHLNAIFGYEPIRMMDQCLVNF